MRAKAGTRPGGRPPFLSRDKKGGKETRPAVCDPFGANLRRGVCGVRRITHCAPSALRSDRRGESVHEASALRRACHPTNTPPQAQPEGGWEAQTTRAIAALGPAFAARSASALKQSTEITIKTIAVSAYPISDKAPETIKEQFFASALWPQQAAGWAASAAATAATCA